MISQTHHLRCVIFILSGKTFPTLDPRTGEVIAHVAEGDAEDINRAVAAARKAFDEGPWPKMTAYVNTQLEILVSAVSSWPEAMLTDGWNLTLQERSRILLRFADLIEKHNDELAALETWDNGKPYEQAAQIEVPMVARLMRYYAGDCLNLILTNGSCLEQYKHIYFHV